MKDGIIHLIAAFTLLSCKAPKPAIPATVKTIEAASAADPKPVISRSEVPAEKPAPIPSKTLVWLDFESGYKKAVAENKIILVDMYTNWCYWCNRTDWHKWFHRSDRCNWSYWCSRRNWIRWSNRSIECLRK